MYIQAEKHRETMNTLGCQNDVQLLHYVVLGGGHYLITITKLFMSYGGKYAAPFPIVIKCNNADEAAVINTANNIPNVAAEADRYTESAPEAFGDEAGAERRINSEGAQRDFYDSSVYLVMGHVYVTLPLVCGSRFDTALNVLGGPVPEKQSHQAHKAFVEFSKYQRAAGWSAQVRTEDLSEQEGQGDRNTGASEQLRVAVEQRLTSERHQLREGTWRGRRQLTTRARIELRNRATHRRHCILQAPARWQTEKDVSGEKGQRRPFLARQRGQQQGKLWEETGGEGTHHGISRKHIKPIHDVSGTHYRGRNKVTGKSVTGATTYHHAPEGKISSPHQGRGQSIYHAKESRNSSPDEEGNMSYRAPRCDIQCSNTNAIRNGSSSNKQRESPCSGTDATWNSSSSARRCDIFGMDATWNSGSSEKREMTRATAQISHEMGVLATGSASTHGVGQRWGGNEGSIPGVTGPTAVGKVYGCKGQNWRGNIVEEGEEEGGPS
ncbi:hypothetical protein CERSUDRAFT_77852 [Gelatoporia subvermispora B]|uniref:Uncharacterized protein n=1 Tax=Ceriporiopsis subvermispora (strain B) TaxID=914234 RepID=M2P8N5_CERS8|nr:hypothetical protein CERSUDRAFT_77852 [Gelatoporia subvermispora B]